TFDTESTVGTVTTAVPKSVVSGMEGVKDIALGLEELAQKHGVLPWTPSRTTCSVEAEAIVRRLGRMPREAEPWMPAANLGPLIIFAHYDPTCQEFWGVPERLTVRVVVTEEAYRLFYDDLAERLRMTP